MEKFDSFIKNGKNCLKWIVLAFTVGCLGGIVGSLFHIAIEYVTHLRLSNKWIIYCLPAGGVLIALMYGIFKKYGISSYLFGVNTATYLDYCSYFKKNNSAFCDFTEKNR